MAIDLKNVHDRGTITVAALYTPDPVVVRNDEPLEKAARTMMLYDVRHLPVVDRRRHVVGILSQRDVLALGPDLPGQASSLMSEDVITIGPDAPAHEAAYLLLHYRIGCLPVTDEDGRLIGIITESDFVRAAYALLGGPVPLDVREREDRESQHV